MTGRGWVATAATAVGLVVLLWVTSAGSAALLDAPARDPGVGELDTPTPTRGSETRTEQPGEGLGMPQQPEQQPTSDTIGSVLVWGAYGVALLLLAVVIAVVVRVIRAAGRGPEQEVEQEPEIPDLLVSEEEADEQLAALGEGSPRNAIESCWLRLEDIVAAAGTPPLPSETSTELTTRVLSAWAVDRHAITELAALYREARFSPHELGEDRREQALTALRRVHADLRRVKPVRAEREQPAEPGAAEPRTGTRRAGRR